MSREEFENILVQFFEKKLNSNYSKSQAVHLHSVPCSPPSRTVCRVQSVDILALQSATFHECAAFYQCVQMGGESFIKIEVQFFPK